MNIKYLQIVVISSFFHSVRRSLENIFLLWICRKFRFDHTITLQLLTFSIVLLFYILPELEVSWCIPYLQHVLYCFISVVLTFSIEKFNIFEIDLKKKILIKVQIKIQHPWKYQRTNLHLISLKPIFLVFPSVKYTWHVDT